MQAVMSQLVLATTLWATLTGCGSPPSPAAPTPAAPVPPLGVRAADPSPSLELGEVTVSFQGHPIARLHADGTTESVADAKPGPDAVMAPGPLLHPDGTIALALHPAYSVRVERHGAVSVLGPAGEQPVGQITGESFTYVSTPSAWAFRFEGDSLNWGGNGPLSQVTGATTPGLRRTVLALVAAFSIDLDIVTR